MTINPSGPADSGDPSASRYAVSYHPDTARLLDLLGSPAVYGTPLMAVRELALNAFDAIRERVACQRLALPASEDAADPQWEIRFNKENQVAMEVFTNRNGRYLTCLDTGTGLDGNIIAHHLLCPGKPPGAAWRALDRQCQERGFRLSGRSRRGLGFLSYFMLAEAVKIRSRRDPICGGNLESGIIFKSSGPHSGTLLRSLRNQLNGTANTKVTLRLKEKSNELGIDFETDLQALLQHTILRTPCALHVYLEKGYFFFPSGWSPELQPHVKAHIASKRPRHFNFRRLPTTSAALDLITALRSIPAENLPQSGVHIETEIHEYYRPGLATLRCTAPWITYRGTKAMVWATDADPDNLGDRYTLIILRRASRTAWQGMHCQLLDPDLPGLQAGPVELLPDSYEDLPPWGYLGIDIDLDEPPLEILALNRTTANLTHAAGLDLKQFCLQSLHHMAGHVRKNHPGTLLAEQMEETEMRLRAVLKDGTFTAPPADSR